MTLKLEERTINDVTILDLEGPLVLGDNDLELRDMLIALQRAGQIRIIVNLKDVSRIDSTGLGTLLFGLSRLRRVGGGLVLLNASRTHLQLLQMTRLRAAFCPFDNEAEAVRSFRADGAAAFLDVMGFSQSARAMAAE